MYENWEIFGFNGLERPDIDAVDDTKKTVAIVDITVDFKKYQRVPNYFRQEGYKTEVKAFVVGSLRAYFAENVGVLPSLGTASWWGNL